MRSRISGTARAIASVVGAGFVFIAATSVAGAATAPAEPVDAVSQLQPQQAPAALDPRLDRVTTRGGWINFSWNDDLVQMLGLTRTVAGGTVERGLVTRQRFALDAGSTFEFGAHGQGIPAFASGQFSFAGGFTFAHGARHFDFRGVRAVLRTGEPLRIDFVSADGNVWFYGDRVMYAIARDGKSLDVESMDLHVAPALAQAIGQPQWADLAIADVQLQSPIASRDVAEQPLACGDPNWPGKTVPGVIPAAKYEADVFMTAYTMAFKRCRKTPGSGANDCDGANTATDGYAVFAPSSTLGNNRNNGTVEAVVAGDPLGTSSAKYTADIRWLRKFAGNVAPYNNDQHPYLIWNLYRFEADGRITQVGKSGVKHAFVSTNTGASCEDCNGGNVLGRACGDTYGSGNNDSSGDLGPRSEIVASTGIWGRCGSIYDPNCDGSSGDAQSTGQFDNRMLVRESSIDASANPGATWMSESWYIVRDDVNIYNTMATRPFSSSPSGTGWTVSDGSPFRLGPVIDRWHDAAPAGQQKQLTELANEYGHAKVAVRVRDLGDGTFRYDYAVQNLDFSRAETSGANPNIRVLSNRGFDGFSVGIGDNTVTALSFGDADIDSTNDWPGTLATGPAAATWSVPLANVNTLDFGTLYRFSFVTSAAPEAGEVLLHVANAGTPDNYPVATLVPAGGGNVEPLPDPMFLDGFEQEIFTGG